MPLRLETIYIINDSVGTSILTVTYASYLFHWLHHHGRGFHDVLAMARLQQYDTSESYKRHTQSFHAARLECDSAASSNASEGRDAAELNTFTHTRRVTLGLGMVNAAGLSAMITGGAITILSRRIPAVKRHILPQRAQWSVSMAIVSASHLANNAAALGILDNAYGQLFASNTATGASMRRVYKSAWGGEPPNAFLRAAEMLANSPIGGDDARLAAKVGRYALLVPFIPDPSGKTTVSARTAFIASTLPAGLLPVDMLEALSQVAEGASKGATTASIAAQQPQQSPISGISDDDLDNPVFDDSSWDPYSPGGTKAVSRQPARPEPTPNTQPSKLSAAPQDGTEDPWAAMFGAHGISPTHGEHDARSREKSEEERPAEPLPSWEVRRRRREEVRKTDR